MAPESNVPKASPPDLPEAPQEFADRLDSWKEIAVHLGRSVRTVRRWEELEGLPVHRHLHQNSASVYALKGELDAWRRGRTEPASADGSGDRDEPAVPAAHPIPVSTSGRWIAGAAGLVLIAAIASIALWRPWSAPLVNERAIRSVAVLPLANVTGDPAEDYLADGLTTALIAELSRFGEPRVISRTSVIQFKGAAKPVPEVARQLNVDGVVKGEMDRSGSRVRISASLVDGLTDRQVWRQSFERDVNELVVLQEELARAIVAATQGDRAPGLAGRPGESKPVNEDAYRLFFRAQLASMDGTEQALRKAVDLCRDAIRKQPDFANAYASIAWYLSQLAVPGRQPATDFMPEMETAAREAVKLDEGLAAAHSMLGLVLFQYRYDWPGAEKELRLALKLNPNDAEAHRLFAQFHAYAGRMQESLIQAERARALDPLSRGGVLGLGAGYRNTGQYDRAIATFKGGLAERPNSPGLHFQLALTHMQAGKLDEGVSELSAAVTASPENRRYEAYLAFAYAISGRRTDAQTILDRLLALDDSQYLPPTAVAHIFIGLRNHRAALSWLEKAYQERDPDLLGPFTNFAMAELRAYPRYREMFAQMGLVR
jgi:TolB-like protein/Flp pilus assembly protein TadD